MSDLVISVENLGKRYRIRHQADGRSHYAALRDVLADKTKSVGRRLWSAIRSPSPLSSLPSSSAPKVEDFWALKDVSYSVRQGEVVGIIGRNGAGKSTLLKILSQITEPTEGRVRIKGRVASLLEVGTGFHPELTGRENVFLNGAILGMSRAEIRDKFDEIVAFAEVEKFLDTPVKRYSSGMYVRLAFAVAAHLEPEILVVDEVLAVGDAAFQKKCLGKMGDVAKQGRTVLFVSHNMAAMNLLCETAMLLNAGVIEASGDARDITKTYLSANQPTSAHIDFPRQRHKRAQFRAVRLLAENNDETADFPTTSQPIVEVSFDVNEDIRGCHVACIVNGADGQHLFSTADTDTRPDLFDRRAAGHYTARVKLPMKAFNTGTYRVAVGLGIPGIEPFDRQEALSFTIHDRGDDASLKESGRRAGLLIATVPWTYMNGNH